MQIPQSDMIMGMKMLGRNRLSRIFVKGSKRAYETKKMDKQALYWPPVKWRLFSRPSSLALPISDRGEHRTAIETLGRRNVLVLSKKDAR